MPADQGGEAGRADRVGRILPAQHADTVLASAFVDFVVRSQGEQALLQLIAALDPADHWTA